MKPPYTKCSWCGEAYHYDCEADEFESNDGDDLDVEMIKIAQRDEYLFVTRCRCGGILAVTTHEDNGSEVLTNGQGDMTL